MLTLSEMTNGGEVLVKASGKVVRVEQRIEDGSARHGVAAIIERYDIMRGQRSLGRYCSRLGIKSGWRRNGSLKRKCNSAHGRNVSLHWYELAEERRTSVL
jgi:hypothetical protein